MQVMTVSEGGQKPFRVGQYTDGGGKGTHKIIDISRRPDGLWDIFSRPATPAERLECWLYDAKLSIYWNAKYGWEDIKAGRMPRWY